MDPSLCSSVPNRDNFVCQKPLTWAILCCMKEFDKMKDYGIMMLLWI